MASTRGLLEYRPVLIGVLIFCSYECVTLWSTILKYSRFSHDPVSIFGLAFAAFITASVTFRSPFFADRIVFGAITVTFMLTGGRIANLTSLAMLTVKGTEALMWTVATTVSLAILLRSFNISRRHG